MPPLMSKKVLVQHMATLRLKFICVFYVNVVVGVWWKVGKIGPLIRISRLPCAIRPIFGIISVSTLSAFTKIYAAHAAVNSQWEKYEQSWRENLKYSISSGAYPAPYTRMSWAFRGRSSHSVKMGSHFRILTRLRMSGALPSLYHPRS